MLSPMISNAMKPQITEAIPVAPRYSGPTCASPMMPKLWMKNGLPVRVQLVVDSGTPA